MTCNTNVDIEFIAHDAFLNQAKCQYSKSKDWKKRNNFKSLGARKSKGINYVYTHLTIFHYV
jgi:hypothetical protein